jgi:hypothetical protein
MRKGDSSASECAPRSWLGRRQLSFRRYSRKIPPVRAERLRDSTSSPTARSSSRCQELQPSGRVVLRDDSALRRSRGRPVDPVRFWWHCLLWDPAQRAGCHAAPLGTSSPTSLKSFRAGLYRTARIGGRPRRRCGSARGGRRASHTPQRTPGRPLCRPRSQRGERRDPARSA